MIQADEGLLLGILNDLLTVETAGETIDIYEIHIWKMTDVFTFKVMKATYMSDLLYQNWFALPTLTAHVQM